MKTKLWVFLAAVLATGGECARAGGDMKRQITAVLCAWIVLMAGWCPPSRGQSTTSSPSRGFARGIQNLAPGAAVSNAIWITPDDYLVLDVTPITAQTNAAISASWRLEDIDGNVTQTTQSTTWNLSAAGPNGIAYQLTTTPRWLVGVQVEPAGSLLQYAQGDQYLNVWINSSPSGNPCPSVSVNCAALQTPINGINLMSLPVGEFFTAGWNAASGGPMIMAYQGTPVYQTQIVTPAAAAECAFVPSSNYRTQVDSILVKLVTSASAGNRVVNFQAASGGGSFFFSPSNANQIASATQWYSFEAGIGGPWSSPTGTFSSSATLITTIPIPMNIVIGGTETSRLIGTSTSGLLAGDQYTCIYRLRIMHEND